MDALIEIKTLLQRASRPTSGESPIFYKTGPGDYAEHDQFIGVSVPYLRKIAKMHGALTLPSIQTLIESPINEERLLALYILVFQYQQESYSGKDRIYRFYLNNFKYINNWNLVDASAHWIIGCHLLNADKTMLLTLAQSSVMWERRISIVSTWYFIKHNEFDWTIKLATILRNDTHDLIHKAVGWMLREVGKRDRLALIHFLDQYAHQLPRTMLRYAIEKFSVDERKSYLLKKTLNP